MNAYGSLKKRHEIERGLSFLIFTQNARAGINIRDD